MCLQPKQSHDWHLVTPADVGDGGLQQTSVCVWGGGIYCFRTLIGELTENLSNSLFHTEGEVPLGSTLSLIKWDAMQNITAAYEMITTQSSYNQLAAHKYSPDFLSEHLVSKLFLEVRGCGPDTTTICSTWNTPLVIILPPPTHMKYTPCHYPPPTHPPPRILYST